jgi:hypothetical protein
MDKPKEQNSPKFFCPLFNFRVTKNEEDITKSMNIQTIEENDSFTRFKFIGDTTIGRINKRDLEVKKGRIILFDEHIAGAFYNKYRGLPVIEIYQESSDNLVSLVENILLALRLFKEGDVFCKIIWSENNLEEIILNPTYEMPSTIHSKIYSLKIEEIGQISEIFERINKTDFDNRRPLRIACNRLNRSYGKSMHDEKIIDFMIAFEALFLRENSTNSGRIIGTGCSVLLGRTDGEREKIYDFFMKAYKLRNKIVHGSAIDYSGIDETQFKLKEYLRKSIMMFL